MDDSTEQGQPYAKQVSTSRRRRRPDDRLPGLLPDPPRAGLVIATRLARVRDRRPGQRRLPRLQVVVDVPGDTFGHGLTDEYYGVSGTDWVDAPILANPSEARTIDGRDYLLFYDGDRLRLVGFKTNQAAYWVNNTLLQSLDEGQMLSIATSMREFEEQVASAIVNAERKAADRRHRGRLGRPGHRRLLRRARPPGGRGRHRRARRSRRCARGEPLPIHEPGLDELRRAQPRAAHVHDRDRRRARRRRLLFCCVDTPPTYSGDADLSRVEAVVAELPDGGEHALVMKSTVPAGTGAAIRRSKPDLVYVSCPEFLKEGSAVKDFLQPDRVVVGADAGSEWAADAVAAAYEPLGGEIVRTDVASAEMIKLASNAFLATKISFINEIANVCEEVGADVTEVARGHGPRRAGSARSSCRRASATGAPAFRRTSPR